MSAREIAAGNRAFVAAAGKGDVEAIANLYTTNAIALPPDSDMVKGRAAIRALWKAAIDDGLVAVKIKSAKVEMNGDFAIDVGHASMSMKPPGAVPTVVDVKYTAIWKNQRGRWRIHLDMWNSTKALG